MKPSTVATVREKDQIFEDAEILRIEQLEEMPQSFEESEGDDIARIALSEIVQAWKLDDEQFTIQLEVVELAAFEFNEINVSTEAIALIDLIDMTTGQKIASFHEENHAARNMLDFISSKSSGFGLVRLGNEIIMIDNAAKSGGATDFIQFEAADGRTISLIGLISDFQEFDMMA